MTIKSVRTKDGKECFEVYVCVISPEDKNLRVQKKKRSVKTLAEAKKFEAVLLREAERELFTREKKAEGWTSLVDAWDVALKDGYGGGKIGKTTGEDYIQALRIYTKCWNNKSIEDIRTFDVMKVLKDMEVLEKSKSRRQSTLTAINHIFKWAIMTGRIKGLRESPGFGISVKRDEEKKPEIFTISQIKKLLEFAKAYDHAWYPIWAVSLLTGMRSGELLALEWVDVDFEARIVTVRKSYNGRLKIVKCPKSGYWRDVPINDDLLLLLKQLRLSSGGRANVLPCPPDWKRGAAAKVIRAFCEGIGLPPIKFHTLRACFATQLLRNRVAPAIVMKICGWKDLKTMQRYIRLAGIEIDGATDSLQLLSSVEVMGKVVDLFGSGDGPSGHLPNSTQNAPCIAS